MNSPSSRQKKSTPTHVDVTIKRLRFVLRQHQQADAAYHVQAVAQYKVTMRYSPPNGTAGLRDLASVALSDFLCRPQDHRQYIIHARPASSVQL